ncbi:MAG: hypothetical protein ACWGO1_10770 [Anaerolineales bacterium]
MSKGRLLAVDSPDSLRRNVFGGDIIHLRTEKPISNENFLTSLADLSFVTRDLVKVNERDVQIVVTEASTALPRVIDLCERLRVNIESIEEYLPPFDEVFVKIIEGYQNHES